jgi:hypothetical protein
MYLLGGNIMKINLKTTNIYTIEEIEAYEVVKLSKGKL